MYELKLLQCVDGLFVCFPFSWFPRRRKDANTRSPRNTEDDILAPQMKKSHVTSHMTGHVTSGGSDLQLGAVTGEDRLTQEDSINPG